MRRLGIVTASLLLACGHSEPFVVADQEIEGPFAAGAPLRLTYSPFFDGTPGLSTDGRWLTYQFQVDTAGDGDRCLAILPADGGQRQRELCPWWLDQAGSADGLDNAALRGDGMIAFTVRRSAPGTLGSGTAGLYFGPADSAAGATQLLAFPMTGNGATTLWQEIFDPIWFDDDELLVLAGQRFLRTVGPSAPPPRDSDRTPRVDTLRIGTEFARIRLTNGQAQITSLVTVEDAIAWQLDRSTGTLHYVAQRGAAASEGYRESFADTVYALPLAGGVPLARYGTTPGGTERPLEMLHGVASGHGRLFVSRSWRAPPDVIAGTIPVGTALQSDIIEVLPDGSTRLVASSPNWRWGRLALAPDGRALYAESIVRVLRQPLEQSVRTSDLYRIDLTP